MKPAVRLLAGLLASLVPLLLPSGITAQGAVAAAGDPRFAGLEWRFVRIRYNYIPQDNVLSPDFYGEPWAIDAPAAEQNLSRRLKTATAIQVEDPLVMSLDDSRLFLYPWIYFVEPGNLALTDADASVLREFLLRGGTAMFDDFHGPAEWDHFAGEMRKVFPNRPIVDLPPDHPVFNSLYRITEYPQIPGLGSFIAGRTWEKGGYVAKLRTIMDETGRAMLFVNWNTDMGDGLEWSNAEDFPGYIRYTDRAYRMAINEIVYALTH